MIVVVGRKLRDYLAGYIVPTKLPPPDGSVPIVRLAPGVSFEEMRLRKINPVKAKESARRVCKAKARVKEVAENAGDGGEVRRMREQVGGDPGDGGVASHHSDGGVGEEARHHEEGG